MVPAVHSAVVLLSYASPACRREGIGIVLAMWLHLHGNATHIPQPCRYNSKATAWRLQVGASSNCNATMLMAMTMMTLAMMMIITNIVVVIITILILM